jgi:excisionase family DNA binding protein
MLSPAEVAELAGLSRTAVYRAIERGELRASRLCGRLRVERSEFEAWKERARVRPRQPHSPMLLPPNATAPAREGSFLSELRGTR